MKKNRLTFLYFLFEKSNISDITESRIANNEFDTTRIIGSHPKERSRILALMYNKYITALPLEVTDKKVSNFSLRKM
jgi:hypothetical protein